MAKIVLFVDALDADDLSGTLTDTWNGYVPSGAPKVTPKVTGEVYTGQSPSQQGMGRNHAHGGERPYRPEAPMLMEKLEAAGYNVLSVFMPYALPTQLQNGAWSAEAMGQQQAGQNPFAQMVQQPPAPGNLMDPEDDGEMAFNARVDELYGRVSAVLNAIRAGGFDVVFIGIRSPDQYTHFQHGEKWRGMLCEDIAHEVKRMGENHDVLWWSDHGNETKNETFRVNRWLMEKGYLDVSIDTEFADRFAAEMEKMNPQAGQQQTVENQMAIGQPGVELVGGELVSGDPYDSCLTVLPDADEKEVSNALSELRDTGYYRYIVPHEEEWGSGSYSDACPDYITHRADNVLVTGNVHPEPIGMGFHRTGVHSARGVWGTTDGFGREQNVTPLQLHDKIWEWVTGESQVEAEVQQRLDQMQRRFESAFDAA